MAEIFFRKYWKEGNTIYYIHFKNGIAIRQIEINENKIVCLSEQDSFYKEYFLYEHSFDELEDVKPEDLISKEEFDLTYTKMYNVRDNYKKYT